MFFCKTTEEENDTERLKTNQKAKFGIVAAELCGRFSTGFAEQGLSVEDFCCKSKLPPETVFTHLRGGFRFFGELNYVCSGLKKRLKIEFMD